MSAPKVRLIALLALALSATGATAKECPAERQILTNEAAGQVFVAQAYGHYEGPPQMSPGGRLLSHETYVIKGKLNGRTAYIVEDVMISGTNYGLYFTQDKKEVSKKLKWTGKRPAYSLEASQVEDMPGGNDGWKITGCRK